MYESPWGTTHARIQILTIEELLAGRPVGMPRSNDIRAATFKKAPRSMRADRSDLGGLFERKDGDGDSDG